MKTKALLAVSFLIVAAASPAVAAQRGGGGGGQRGGGGRGAQPPRQTAAIDLTGNWVSVVTEDWKFRMVTPAKGNYAAVPMTAEARRFAEAWDPAKDEAASEQCRSYGAAAIMRVPTRLRIAWQDDNTLKIETDAGEQTRLFHFGGTVPDATQASWQGYSIADWEQATVPRGQPRLGDLKVVTTKMKLGYLRKNGVPYGPNTVLTEWYDRYTTPLGDVLVVTTEVRDPQYLNGAFVTTSHFKKEADGAKWSPEPCTSR